MKYLINLLRIGVGALFIFSGFIKAIDPTGLTYKMEEFFEVWSNNDLNSHPFWHFFHKHAMKLSITMITAEIMLGLALILGYYKKITSWLLLLLIVFFTFLTSYVLFNPDKVKACGCFGDCIKLTPKETFTKDIILLVAIILIVLFSKYIKPLFNEKWQTPILLLALVATVFFQFRVLHHLPPKDCLPFAKGNNIAELIKKPAGADDVYKTAMIYRKDGVEKDFSESVPDDIDTWEFIRTEKTLVKKGTGEDAKIKDFILSDTAKNDVTNQILGIADSTTNNYCLFYVRDWDNLKTKWISQFKQIHSDCKQKNIPLYVITSQLGEAQKFFYDENKIDVPILTLDTKVVYTAARAPVVLYKMKGGLVEDKIGFGDLNKVKI